MKQDRNFVHTVYNYSMIRRDEYDWEGTNELVESDFVCGFCGGDITSKSGYTGWIKLGLSRVPQQIYICHKCGQPNFFAINRDQHPKFKKVSVNFSDAVRLISPKFVTIYSQSHDAEEHNLDEIAGPGYGKALEFLVKDYLIRKLPQEANKIKHLSLGDCIRVKIDNPRIKVLAGKARILRNDETHYERKYEELDINDLKKLINATASWIDLEHYTDEATPE